MMELYGAAGGGRERQGKAGGGQQQVGDGVSTLVLTPPPGQDMWAESWSSQPAQPHISRLDLLTNFVEQLPPRLPQLLCAVAVLCQKGIDGLPAHRRRHLDANGRWGRAGEVYTHPRRQIEERRVRLHR